METDTEKKPGPPRLSLDGAKQTRATLARLLRLRFRGEIDSVLFRDMFYGLNVALGYDRLLADLRIEERMDALEAAIAAQEKKL